ncbi:glycosyltransferase 2 protein [Rutstroemia sp. NJR-2017a BBW]|nr:glycosyltransferase 2 protein [Rutstroemia sp. NJR-2017a BBW]
MPLPPRLFPGDVELGKRDDDHKPGSKTSLGMAWKHRNTPHVRNRLVKRVIIGLLVGIGVYYFYKNMPTDLSNPRPRPRFDRPGETPAHAPAKAALPKGNPIRQPTSNEIESEDLTGHNFNGPINFYQLASTLHAMSTAVKGYEPINNNVCEKRVDFITDCLRNGTERKELRTFYIHGKSRDTNGYTAICEWSLEGLPDILPRTDFRMEVSCSAGLKHINNFVHPQAVIIDGSGDEDDFLISGFRSRTNVLQRTLIELPADVEQNLMWITQLDSAALSDRDTGSLLTLHHRIPQHSLTAEENSIRFLESFWPAEPTTSHVLVLSPQVELSPLFYHFLKYTLLEYRYSYNRSDFQKNMLAISLDLPSTYLNDSAEFSPPPSPNANPTPFLWQAPNSNAALYFGEKWVELHDFIARVISSQRSLPPPTTLRSDLVSRTYPSWLEHILKLARARGYWTLYPHFESWDALSTTHTDLYSPPEEYTTELNEDSDFTANPAEHLSLKHKEKPLLTTTLQSLLSELPELAEMPLLSWDGYYLDHETLELKAGQYSQVFRHEIGACAEGTVVKQRINMLAGDLFCSGNEPLQTPAAPATETGPDTKEAPASKPKEIPVKEASSQADIADKISN